MDNKMKIELNRDQIKYIAVFTMLLNHVANIFLQPGTFACEALKDIGYFTAPVASLIGMNKTIQDASIAADRLFEIMDIEHHRPRSVGIVRDMDFAIRQLPDQPRFNSSEQQITVLCPLPGAIHVP